MSPYPSREGVLPKAAKRREEIAQRVSAGVLVFASVAAPERRKIEALSPLRGWSCL